MFSPGLSGNNKKRARRFDGGSGFGPQSALPEGMGGGSSPASLQDQQHQQQQHPHLPFHLESGTSSGTAPRQQQLMQKPLFPSSSSNLLDLDLDCEDTSSSSQAQVRHNIMQLHSSSAALEQESGGGGGGGGGNSSRKKELNQRRPYSMGGRSTLGTAGSGLARDVLKKTKAGMAGLSGGGGGLLRPGTSASLSGSGSQGGGSSSSLSHHQQQFLDGFRNNGSNPPPSSSSSSMMVTRRNNPLKRSNFEELEVENERDDDDNGGGGGNMQYYEEGGSNVTIKGSIYSSLSASAASSFNLGRRNLQQQQAGMSSSGSRSYSYTLNSTRPFTQTSAKSSSLQSRPLTQTSTNIRPHTAISTVATFSTAANQRSNIILALSEARRGVQNDIGLACINLTSGECLCLQFLDTSTYSLLLAQLYLYAPGVILIFQQPDQQSKMYQAVGSILRDISKVVLVARKTFNDVEGLSYLSAYGIRHEGVNLLNGLEGNYFVLTACSALFHHVIETMCIHFQPNSLKIKYQSLSGGMMIDLMSAHYLELVYSSVPQSSSLCLLKMFATETAMGERLLKAFILQPLMSAEDIKLRQDAAAEFREDVALKKALSDDLANFADLDHLISAIIQLPKNKPRAYAEQSINRVILFKSIIEQTLNIQKSLVNVNSELLKDALKVLSSHRIGEIYERTNEVIDNDITHQKTPLGLRNQRCYAVKKGYNGLLDVARQTYKEFTEDIHELAAQYGAEHSLPIKLQFTIGVGFYLQMATVELGEKELPEEFINVVDKGKLINFTSMQLICLNERISESLSEVYSLSESIVMELLVYIHGKLPILYQISESIAFLDVLLSFAKFASVGGSFVFPEFTETLALKNSRHPILERKIANFKANDAFASPDTRLQLITGVNMSGKSIYLSQLALLQVLSQIGSYLPCEFASIRLTNKLLTRIGLDDGSFAQCSSFTSEMRECAFVLDQVTDKSMIIIDEMGRGTSISDAVGVNIAVLETLLQSKAFVFVATHFTQVCNAFESCPNAVCLQLGGGNPAHHAEEGGPRDNEFKVKSGICGVEHYGVNLAKKVGFKNSVLAKAKEISTHIQISWRQQVEASDVYQEQKKKEMAIRCAGDLLHTLRNSTLDEDSLKKYLQEFQAKMAGSFPNLTGRREG